MRCFGSASRSVSGSSNVAAEAEGRMLFRGALLGLGALQRAERLGCTLAHASARGAARCGAGRAARVARAPARAYAIFAR
jgi:hypothetical protein